MAKPQPATYLRKQQLLAANASATDIQPQSSGAVDSGIVVDEVLHYAEDIIGSRQSAVQSLRVLAEQLRSALARVEAAHVALTSEHNPPMSVSQVRPTVR